jgi:predicted transcriptional regulator
MKYEKWSDFKKKIYSTEEIANADEKADLICSIINARKQQGLSQRDLEGVTGIRQPIIARLEKGLTYPRYDTVLKILRALGKTLAVVDVKSKKLV